MKRMVFIMCGICIVVLPLVVVVWKQWGKLQEVFVTSRFLLPRKNSSQYKAEGKVPGTTIAIVDTAFLEYIVSTFHIYEDDAIADPAMYFNAPHSTKRYTVSNLVFELVPTITKYMVGLGGSSDFAGRGTYVVDGDTLTVRISLNKDQLVKGVGNVKFNMEDMFLDTALQTLVFATAKSGAPLSPFELNKMQKAMKDNIPTGIFPRPIKIEEQE